jgi:hypothetical protein
LQDSFPSALACALALSASRRSKANSQLSGVGCTYRRDTVTLECPASFMIVNASGPTSPRTGEEGMAEPVKDELAGEENDFFPLHYWFADATVEMI